MNFPTINSHNGWDSLLEVWLGDVYPESWYSHLPAEIADNFSKITEITKQDLTVIHNKLADLGVCVRRPVYTNINDYIDPGLETLYKPEITPRDNAVVVGNCLVIPKNRYRQSQHAWGTVLAEYEKDTRSSILYSEYPSLYGANTVRYGRDLLIDLMVHLNQENIENFKKFTAQTFPEYRLHYVVNGGHMDGCFTALKPGQLMTTTYFKSYDTYFPNWEKMIIGKPEFHLADQKPRKITHNGKFRLPGVVFPDSFNKHVIELASDWVGNYTETYFEVNCLVVDPTNILVLGENELAFKKLEEMGFTVHSMPFRARTFWDGGLHCLTLDIRRASKIEDYFSDSIKQPGDLE